MRFNFRKAKYNLFHNTSSLRIRGWAGGVNGPATIGCANKSAGQAMTIQATMDFKVGRVAARAPC